MQKRTVLVVDDSAINRRILCKMLGPGYTVLEAEDGQQALDIMGREHHVISAVLLDIVMPVMDGYAVLEKVRRHPALAQIPIIVITGDTQPEMEERALTLGANDYVTKPFSANILKRRLENLIKLRETSAMVNTLQKDKLTGVWNREAFFQKADWEIKRKPAGHFALVCVDIDNFKVINDQYGTEKGDGVLRDLARILLEKSDANGGLCGRISADHFISLIPVSVLVGGFVSLQAVEMQLGESTGLPVTLSAGRYIVDDKRLNISAMYDRAVLARNTVRGRFDRHVAQYDESMRSRLVREQEIINGMNGALEAGQFEAWYQPQYNHTTGALIGAEALVRWRHPVWGLVPPAEFIPVFEQTGFIYKLDQYVWRQVCFSLRKWTDEGREVLPISVNISRYDLLCGDLVDTITGLTREYGLPPSLLRLEITESAFATSTKQIVEVVERLVRCGFTVEIDDFGSGYSSLNTLKDVPAQVVKLDMRFLEGHDNLDRGGNIIESVVRMCKWLGMPVVAEGVERVEQADYLETIGCNYVQGYLYARPMAAPDYETLAQSADKEARLFALKTVENLDNNAFWNPESMDTLIFNSFVGGACIYEWCDGKIEILRANQKYAQAFGGKHSTVTDVLRLNWEDHMDAEAARVTREAVERAIKTCDDVTFEAAYNDLPGAKGKTYLRTTFRAIASAGGRTLIYATNENITAQREAERKEREAAARVKAIMDNVNGGVSAATLTGGEIGYIFVNDRYYEMFGYTREQFERELPRGLIDLIVPEDLLTVYGAAETTTRTGKSAQFEFRVRRRDRSVIWVRSNSSVCEIYGVNRPVHLAVLIDVTREKEALERIRAMGENLRNMMEDTPGGFARLRVGRDGTLATVYVNGPFCRMRGMISEQILSSDGADAMDTVHPDDRQAVREAVWEMLMTGETRRMIYRLRRGDGTYKPFNVFARVSRSESGDAFINAYYADLTEREKDDLTVREAMPFILSALMRSSTDLSYAKDKSFRYLCCSRPFAQMVGFDSDADVVGKTDYDLFDRETADKYRAVDQKLIESGEPLVDCLETIPSSDGLQHYANTSKYILRDSTGEIIGLYGCGRDVTQTRSAFEQLKLLIDSTPGGLATYRYSPAGLRPLYLNDGFFKFSGYTRAEYESLTKDDPLALIHPDDLPAVKAGLQALARGEKNAQADYRCLGKDGTYRWFSMRGAVQERRGDEIVFHVVQYDIDRDKAAQRQILDANEQMQAIMRNVEGGVAAITVEDGRLRCLYANEQYSRMFGYTPEQFAAELPNGLMDIIHPDDRLHVRDRASADRKAHSVASAEFRVICRDGHICRVRGNASVCRLQNVSAPVQIVALFDAERFAEAARRPGAGDPAQGD